MNDEVERGEIQSLVDDILLDDAESPWTTPLNADGATVDTEPSVKDPSARLSFVEFPLSAFHRGKLLWAANYFVLWPLGVALTVDVETSPVDPDAWCKSERVHDAHLRKAGPCAGAVRGGGVSHLHLREWSYPADERGETINQEPEENQADYLVFLAYVRERVLSMKPEERRVLLGRYAHHSIATADQLITVEP